MSAINSAVTVFKIQNSFLNYSKDLEDGYFSNRSGEYRKNSLLKTSKKFHKFSSVLRNLPSSLLIHKCRISCSTAQPIFIKDAKSMDEIYSSLASHLLEKALLSSPSSKYVVALAGPPGAGKSTVAKRVIELTNALWVEKHNGEREESVSDVAAEVAAYVPMDGFHLYRWQLDLFPDPKEAHARRGAPWTFDPSSLFHHLAHIKKQGWGYIPSFDHGVGDPIERDIIVHPNTRVLLVEGNYLLLQDGEWKKLQELFDEKWFIDIDINEAMSRVYYRHLHTGKPEDVSKWRVEYNDRPNAVLIQESSIYADLIIPSINIA